MKLKAILLDIDGTLLDSNEAHARAWQAALAKHGRTVPYETLRPLIGKGGDKLLLEAVGVDETSEEGARITGARRDHFVASYLGSLRATRGARALLETFLERNLKLIVATSASIEDVGQLLRQARLDDLVQMAATSSEAAKSKPDPDIVQAALRKAGLRASEAMMLGDTPYDIQAASAARVPCVVLRCGGWWKDEAFEGAAAIYDDPTDLLGRFDSSPFAQS